MVASLLLRSSRSWRAAMTTIDTHRSLYIKVPRGGAVQEKSRTKNQKKKNKKGKSSYRFVDRTRVRAVAGTGGKGSLSTAVVGRGYKKRPDGGNGGNGGHVIIVADPQTQTLRQSNPHVIANNGNNGAGQDRNGRNGKNCIVRVPCGVVVQRVLDHDEKWDEQAFTVRKRKQGTYGFEEEEDDVGELYGLTAYRNKEAPKVVVDIPGFDMSQLDGSNFEDGDFQNIDDDYGDEDDEDVPRPVRERRRVILADLDEPGSWVVVARGGQGGEGNGIYTSESGPLPDPEILVEQAQGEPGEIAFLELELKLIADVGLVGFPNAGKSSILAAMSRAGPEIAPYPFTTLHPLMGVIEYRDGFTIKAADIPGLVAGASEGRGRGHDFLRHVERTKALLFVLDAAGTDGRDPVDDFRTLVHELDAYNHGELTERPSIVVANKVDLLTEEECEELLSELALVAEDGGINTDGNVIGTSAGVSGEGLNELSKKMRELVIQVDEENSMEDKGAYV